MPDFLNGLRDFLWLNELFDFKLDLLSQGDMRRLARIREDWARWKEENPNGLAEEFIRWSLNTSSHRRSRVSWYVTRRLSQPFMTRIQGNFATLMINDRRARELEGTIRARAFLELIQDSELSGIITSNYDMLAEFALGTAGFNYGDPGECLVGRGHNPQFPWQNTPVYLTGNRILAKVHGSLSWDHSNRYTDGKPGRAGRALIVPPAPEKKPPSVVTDMWRLANTILKTSNVLIVFGFAFNPYDVALLDLLKSSGKNLKKVLLVDPFPKLKSAATLWPNANITTVTRLKNVIGEVRDWL